MPGLNGRQPARAPAWRAPHTAAGAAVGIHICSVTAAGMGQVVLPGRPPLAVAWEARRAATSSGLSGLRAEASWGTQTKALPVQEPSALAGNRSAARAAARRAAAATAGDGQRQRQAGATGVLVERFKLLRLHCSAGGPRGLCSGKHNVERRGVAPFQVRRDQRRTEQIWAIGSGYERVKVQEGGLEDNQCLGKGGCWRYAALRRRHAPCDFKTAAVGGGAWQGCRKARIKVLEYRQFERGSKGAWLFGCLLCQRGQAPAR